MHVVFGAGQVGSGLARTLVARGERVRVVRRGSTAVEGAELASGDARDPAFVRAATEGAAVVYHCMNPSAYRSATWEAELPALGDALLGAAHANGFKLVCLDNLYGYGPVEGHRVEDTPMAAEGRKSRVRVAWDAALRGSGIRWASGRAGDFFGPGVADQSLFSPRLLSAIAGGSTAWLVGDPAAPHAFGYVPDVVDGLLALGTSDAEGVWHLPTHTLPPAELVRQLAEALGTPAKVRAVPGWVLSVAGPFVPLLGELRETLYQWDRPFLVDDRKFRARFPGVGATTAQAVADTVADYINSRQNVRMSPQNPPNAPNTPSLSPRLQSGNG